MSTPEESFEIAADGSSSDEDRTQAIDQLEAANECGALSKLVLMDDVDQQYREQALTSLAHPQCEQTLRTLVEDEDLPESLHDRAETLLEETPDDAGAGP